VSVACGMSVENLDARSIVSAVPVKSNGEAVGRAYEQLADTMRVSILSGKLPQGQRLPPEAQMANEAGVSRSTVREALRLLQESGFLERVSPKILVVRGATETSAHRAITHALRRRTVTFAALHEALLLLEPGLASLAAERRDESDLEELRSILALQTTHMRDYEEWCRLDNAFHVAIAEASKNAPLVLARAALGDVLVPAVARFVHNERATEAAIEYHERIREQIAVGDPELASVIARRHIENFREAWERSGLAYEDDLMSLINGPHSSLA
jgi:GntR family transcriptional regulator, transcriptional repressor for pyruvate dehydrogenase complex